MTEQKKKGRRPQTRFWVWAEQWLLGSTRTELKHEERGVFMDFLCLAALAGGCIEVYSPDQLAAQLLIKRELLDRCIEKFIKTGKILPIYITNNSSTRFFIRTSLNRYMSRINIMDRKSSFFNNIMLSIKKKKVK